MLKVLVFILSKLPLRLHYWFSSWLLYPLIYYIVRYRRRIVELNIEHSFPNLSVCQRRTIVKAFYKQLTDMFVEDIYGYSASEEELLARVHFTNPDLVALLARQTGGCLMLLGHVGNWQWLCQIAKRLKPYGVNTTFVYATQHNKSVNNLLLAMRSKSGGTVTPTSRLLRSMLEYDRQSLATAYGMLIDQKPRPEQEHLSYQNIFLHQPTKWQTGSDSLARRFSYGAVYAHISRPQRGYYVIDFRLITDDSQKEPENAITERFATLLEENIHQQPELWLWSHNRWRIKLNR